MITKNLSYAAMSELIGEKNWEPNINKLLN